MGHYSCVLATLVLSTALAECLTESNCNCPPKACEVRVRTDAGWVCGRVRNAEDGTKYASFRGVPYAKPPLGDRRFKELEPPTPWADDLDATEEGPVCPQKDFMYNRIPLQLKGMSEDCIYLNLHIPLGALKSASEINGTYSALPILVFVHGGAFQAGSGLTDLHGPEYLLTKPVIVITFNFRIGVFGFLSLNSAKIPGNQGLRDVVTLLHWVQRNARAFGGNPGDVTLVGHSTGAISAHLLSLSKVVKGLIHKVVLMSGCANSNTYSTSPTHAKNTAESFLGALDINSTDADYIHDRLVREPLLNIMEALIKVQLKSDIIQLSFGPVVESEFLNVTRILDDEPLVLIAEGRGKEYPMIVGFTSAEFYFFKWIMETADILNRIGSDPTLALGARIRNTLSLNRQITLGNEVKRKYLKGIPSLEKVLDLYSDLIFVYPALKAAQWRAMIGGAPVYLYQFSYESTRNMVQEALWATYRGVAHVEDLTYLFRTNTMLRGYTSYPPTNRDDLMKHWFTEAIANFIRCRNPTCTKQESGWPPLSRESLQYQDFAEPMVHQMRNLTVQQKNMVDFFDSVDAECRDVAEKIKLNTKKIRSI